MGRYVSIGTGVVVTVVLVVGIVVWQRGGEPDESGVADQGYSRRDVLRTLASAGCPQLLRDQAKAASYRPAADTDPQVDAAFGPQFTRRTYCLTSFVWEKPRDWRLTSYTVSIKGDGFNYGQAFTTTDAQGSEELMNFPFLTTVHGPCAHATGVAVLTDRRGRDHRYTASLRIGPHCRATG